MNLRSGLRRVRRTWADEWRIAHLTMDAKRWQVRLGFVATTVPLLLLLTPLLFVYGVWGARAP
jgi:hypothetical protein